MISALHVFDDAEHPAALNMALDEALLETATAPSIRFYGWSVPSISFGYFSRYADVANDQRQLVRRWTGGGIVPHGDDLTYSIILPMRNGEKLPPARIIYTQIHDALRRALPIAATLASDNAPKISDACFANPVTADVLANGAKIAGAAQRRTRAGLLHQGSIQLPNLPRDFRTAFAATLCPSFEEKSFAPSTMARARELAERKYGTREWLMLR